MHHQAGNLYLSLMLLATALVAPALSGQPTYADCMKNPFASGCRGISAKRSQLEPLIGEPQPAGVWAGEPALTWLRPRQLNYRLANLQASQSADSARYRYEQEPAAVELYQIFNEAPAMRPLKSSD